MVDDSRAIRVTMMDTLRKINPTAVFVEAGHGEEALRSYIDGRFDMVFLDLVMPGPVDGLSVLRRILELDPRARVAIITGLPDGTPEVVGALSEGAFAYLRKPISSETLRQIVDRATRESGQSGTIR